MSETAINPACAAASAMIPNRKSANHECLLSSRYGFADIIFFARRRAAAMPMSVVCFCHVLMPRAETVR